MEMAPIHAYQYMVRVLEIKPMEMAPTHVYQDMVRIGESKSGFNLFLFMALTESFVFYVIIFIVPYNCH